MLALLIFGQPEAAAGVVAFRFERDDSFVGSGKIFLEPPVVLAQGFGLAITPFDGAE